MIRYVVRGWTGRSLSPHWSRHAPFVARTTLCKPQCYGQLLLRRWDLISWMVHVGDHRPGPACRSPSHPPRSRHHRLGRPRQRNPPRRNTVDAATEGSPDSEERRPYECVWSALAVVCVLRSALEVTSDEGFDCLVGRVVVLLLWRRLHEVGRRGDEGPADAAIESDLRRTNGIDDDSGRVR